MAQDISWLNLVARVPGGDVRAVLPALQSANHDGVVELADTMRDANGRAAMLAHTLAVESFSRGFSGLRARFSDGLFVLTGMVALVLLVTCANIAGLLLARGTGQARDLGIRIALGATTGRLLRQGLTDSLALALLGGALGVLCSRSASSFLARQVIGSSGTLPLVFAPDARVLGFAVGISVAAALVFGLAPALGAVTAGRRAALVKNQRQAVGESSMNGMRTLVVAQLALSVVVVFAAILFGRTLINLMRVDPGFAVDGLVTMSFDPISSGYSGDQLPALARRLGEAARTVPGVVAASASTCGLIAGCSSSGGFRIEGAEGDGHTLYRNWVSPEYFSTVGMRLLAGRDFADRDTDRAPLIAVVNESIVHRYFSGENPIGKRLGYSKPDVQIVGIVRDARTQTLHDLPVPMVYFPIDQKPAGSQPALTNLDVRVVGISGTVEPALRAAIQRAEPNLLIGDAGAMSRRLARDLTRERLIALLALGFGGLTLLLAALGLYGVLSYGVVRRTREIGVRMALGARRAEVLALVGYQSARLTVVGLAIGLSATAAASRYLSGLLFGVTPLDPIAFALVMIALAIVTTLASLVPARRATHVDPLVALRCE